MDIQMIILKLDPIPAKVLLDTIEERIRWAIIPSEIDALETILCDLKDATDDYLLEVTSD